MVPEVAEDGGARSLIEIDHSAKAEVPEPEKPTALERLKALQIKFMENITSEDDPAIAVAACARALGEYSWEMREFLAVDSVVDQVLGMYRALKWEKRIQVVPADAIKK